MQAVILAGGKGTHLRPLTSVAPKPMVKLFDKPVLEHTIELLKRHGITDIIITLASEAEQVIDYFGGGSRWGVNIQYSLEDIPKGTAGGLRRIQPLLHNTFLVISGDAVTDFDLTSAVAFHRQSSAIATILLYEAEDPSQFGIVRTDSSGKVSHFRERPKPSEAFSNLINTGIYVLEPEVISCVPYDAVYDFSRDVVPRLLQNQEPFYAFRADGYWCDIENLAQYRNVHFDALLGKVKLNLTARRLMDGIWVGSDADIHPTARLVAPVYVGNGATLRRQCTLGRFAVLGDMSVVDDEAQVTHSILDARSCIGKRTEIYGSIIGSGFQVPNNGRLVDEVVVNDGSHAGLRAEISSELLMPKALETAVFTWSGLEAAGVIERASLRRQPLAA